MTAVFVTFSSNTAPQGGTDVYVLSDTDKTSGGVSGTAKALLVDDILGQSGSSDVGDFVANAYGPAAVSPTLTASHDLLTNKPATGAGRPNVMSITYANPNLGPLADNGGPTQTMKLLKSSLAIGEGITVTGIFTDQRGLARANPPSIGAVEPSTIIIVNTLGDAPALNPASGNPDTNSSLSGIQCTLRSAIQVANILGAAGTPATINFDIPLSAGAPTIAIHSALPVLTSKMTINGLSQPGATADTPTVVVDGSAAKGSVIGLDLESSNNTIEGLIIGGFGGDGIYIHLSDSNTIVDNWIGVQKPNAGNGIDIFFSRLNNIGNIGPGSSVEPGTPGNVISGNKQNGILINGGYGPTLAGNTVQNNIIGLTADGRILGNDLNGIRLGGNANNNVIGDTLANVEKIGNNAAANGNAIAYNGNDGVLNNSSSSGNSILSNIIYSNVGIQVHVGPGDGPTANTANGPTNYPYISPPSATGGLTVTLNSTKDTSFVIQVFATIAPAFASETSIYVGTDLVTTDDFGNYEGTLAVNFTKTTDEVPYSHSHADEQQFGGTQQQHFRVCPAARPGPVCSRYRRIDAGPWLVHELADLSRASRPNPCCLNR